MNKQTFELYTTLRNILNDEGNLWRKGITNKPKQKQTNKKLKKKRLRFSFFIKAKELQLKCDRNFTNLQKNKRLAPRISCMLSE